MFQDIFRVISMTGKWVNCFPGFPGRVGTQSKFRILPSGSLFSTTVRFFFCSVHKRVSHWSGETHNSLPCDRKTIIKWWSPTITNNNGLGNFLQHFFMENNIFPLVTSLRACPAFSMKNTADHLLLFKEAHRVCLDQWAICSIWESHGDLWAGKMLWGQNLVQWDL